MVWYGMVLFSKNIQIFIGVLRSRDELGLTLSGRLLGDVCFAGCQMEVIHDMRTNQPRRYTWRKIYV
jgi:hypothetical protein